MTPDARTSAGFTLVELLVGLSLLALISVLLFGGFRFGLRAWEVGTARIDSGNEIELAQNLLRRQLAEAQPVRVGVEIESAPVLLRGSTSALIFVSPLPAHRGIGGAHLFALGIGDGASGKKLTLRWRLFRAGDPGDAAFDPKDASTLLTGIETIELSYFGRPATGGPRRWNDRWEEQPDLPELIRLRIAFPPGDGRSWPDLVVAPRLRISS
jgi:general secretion pathway protein J